MSNTLWKRLMLVTAIVALAMGLPVTAQAHADGLYGRYLVVGRIEQAYLDTGGPGTWGNPTMSEAAAANGGRFQRFAKDTSFYWNPRVSYGVAHQVGGAIRAKWAALNWERGALGYPVNNEQGHQESSTPGARSNDFQGGVIFWSAPTGAHPVWGEILNKWVRAGATKSSFGLPVGDEYRIGTRYAQNFQQGTILWP